MYMYICLQRERVQPIFLYYEEDILNIHCHEFVYIYSARVLLRISPPEVSRVKKCRTTFYFFCIIDLVMYRQGCVNFQDILMIFTMLYEGCTWNTVMRSGTILSSAGSEVALKVAHFPIWPSTFISVNTLSQQCLWARIGLKMSILG